MYKDKTSPKLIFIRIAKVSMGVLKMKSVFEVSSCFLESLLRRLSFFLQLSAELLSQKMKENAVYSTHI